MNVVLGLSLDLRRDLFTLLVNRLLRLLAGSSADRAQILLVITIQLCTSLASTLLASGRAWSGSAGALGGLWS
jgi:hypothetical protein